MKTYESNLRIHSIFLIMISINLFCCYSLNDWEKLNEKSLPEKEEFYSSFNLVSNTDSY